MKKITYLLQPLAALLLTAALASAQGRIISMNLAPAQTGNAAIDPEETYGVPELGSVTGNWSNESWNKTDLKWDDGSLSTVGMDVQFRNERLFFGPGFINTPMNYGVPHYEATPTDPGTGLDFYNLDQNFPDGYFVIVYIMAFIKDPTTAGSVTNGRTTFYFRPPADNQTPVTPDLLLQTTVTSDPGAGNYPEAHYAVFGSKELPLSSPFLSIRIGHVGGGGVGLGGVQIVSASDIVVPTGWAGYEINEMGMVDTGPAFLGWLAVETESMWVYSFSLKQWIAADPAYVAASDGAWFFTGEAANLELVDIDGNWSYSAALDTWIWVPGGAVSGPAWVFAVDSSLDL